MKFDAALAFYKTQTAIARALGRTRQQVNSWRETGVIPAKHAVILEVHSKGKVKVDPSVYVRNGANSRV
jgi:hypothetical protein